MQNPRPNTNRSIWYALIFVFVTFSFLSQTSMCLQAQSQESGSTTGKESSEAGTEVPAIPDLADTKTDEDKDERPRELGVMVLIVWLLAGAGIGILIFTSLFGHSIRSMIRRPYPPQAYQGKQPPPDTTTETNTDSEPGDEELPKS